MPRLVLICFALFFQSFLLFESSPAQTALSRPPTAPINLNYLRVDFIIPGARASALGGAFIAASLDETASAINPAGLTYLTQPGASLHQRQAHAEFNEPEGSPAFPNRQKEFSDNSFDQILVNIVYPVKRLAFSTFRQVAVDSRFTFETHPFLTTTSSLTPEQLLSGLGNVPGRQVDLSLEVVNNGIAVAFALSNRISLGASGKISELNMSLTERTFLDPQITPDNPIASNSAEHLYSITSLNTVKRDPSFSFGILAKLILDRLFIGGVLNINPRFDVQSNIVLTKYSIDSTTFDREIPGKTVFKFAIPDTYGIGLYYVASDQLRFSFDAVRIEYRDLLHGNDLNVAADDVFNSQTRSYEDPDASPDLTIDNVFELHLGIEYLWKIPRLGLAPVRVGFFTDPGHRIYARKNDPDLRRLFPKEKNRVHFTFGSGLIFSNNLKIDGSINYSTDGFELVGSTLITFPF